MGALEEQWQELDALIDELGPDDLQRPTRCPPLTVRELLVHLTGAFRFWTTLLSNQPSEQPGPAAGGWWTRTSGSAEGDRIIESARQAAAGFDDAELVACLRDAAGTYLDALRTRGRDEVCGLDGMISTLVGDLATLSVIEVGVHTMDIGHATLRGERIHPSATVGIAGALSAMLGSPLPGAIGWDDKTFVLTGTGRRPLSETERHTLGPLADRFPLLS